MTYLASPGVLDRSSTVDYGTPGCMVVPDKNNLTRL
jgi:hypothetical protein